MTTATSQDATLQQAASTETEFHGAGLGWFDIVRLGLVQTALGAIVVLTTSTLNRVMVVELALPALLPGALVGFHYAVQLSRPRWGYGSDVGGKRTPWIIGGLAVLAIGGVLAAVATAWMATALIPGIVLAAFAFLLIGVGVGASGTSLLTLLATTVAPGRRAAAASIVWIMMIAGFVVTAATAGAMLDPFSMSRLVAVTAAVSAIAFAVTLVAVAGVERSAKRRQIIAAAAATKPMSADAHAASAQADAADKPSFAVAFAEVWQEPEARRFTIFVFVSMLAYNLQDLILEPFAGLVFGMTPGQSTQLAGVQHGGVLAGMILVAVGATFAGAKRAGYMRGWIVGGCLASAVALMGLAVSGYVGASFPLKACVFALGLANGAFAVAAIGSMMALAGKGRKSREGVRMGMWGAAQAIAFGLGGFLGAAAVDVNRALMGNDLTAFSTVFAVEGGLFLVAAVLAARVAMPSASDSPTHIPILPSEDGFALQMSGRTS